jgi:hypothetical protein
MGTLHEYVVTFMTISSWNYLRMRNALDKIKTHTSRSIIFFFLNRPGYEIMSKNVVEPQVADDNMAHARCLLDK